MLILGGSVDGYEDKERAEAGRRGTSTIGGWPAGAPLQFYVGQWVVQFFEGGGADWDKLGYNDHCRQGQWRAGSVVRWCLTGGEGVYDDSQTKPCFTPALKV